MSDCWFREIDFNGWQDSVEFGNDLIRVVVVPALGGRIMAYDLANYSFLYTNEELFGRLFTSEENYGDGSIICWKNYGGDKTWPAPQGWTTEQEWHGPPDPILDTGIYKGYWVSCNHDEAVYQVESPFDPKTGIKIFRKISIRRDSSKIWLSLKMENMSPHPVRWSLWNITQLDTRDKSGAGYNANCRLYIPLNPKTKFNHGYQVIFGEGDNPQWGHKIPRADDKPDLLVIPYMAFVGKIGIDSNGGWAAFVNDTEGFLWSVIFPYFPVEENVYPDDGCSVECWTVGKGIVSNKDYSQETGYHLEAEILSPLRTLQPGQSHDFRLEMGVAKHTGTISDVQAVGFIEALSCDKTETGCRLKISGGIFYKGLLNLNIVAEDGQILPYKNLVEVNPLIPLNVCFDIPKDVKGYTAILQLNNENNLFLGILTKFQFV